MTNEELIELRKMLGKYTDFLLSQSKLDEVKNIDGSILALANYVDRANMVTFDVETLIVVN